MVSKTRKINRVEKFFETYSSHTTGTYRWVLKKFFSSIYGNGKLENQVERYFSGERDYEEDVSSFFVKIRDEAPLTVINELAVVRVFLSSQDVNLPPKFWRDLRRRRKGSRALTQDRIPSHAELRSILNHMDIKGRALFLTLASSGMRIGEIMMLKLSDINLECEPAKIRLRGEYCKNGNPRTVFISKEAREAVKEFFKIRESYIKSAARRSHLYPQGSVDDRIFPFSTANAMVMWHGALRKAGLDARDSSTNWRELHIHVLRKFFSTQMEYKIPKCIIEALMGHEGYLDGA